MSLARLVVGGILFGALCALLPFDVPQKHLAFLVEVNSSFSNLYFVLLIALAALVGLTTSRQWGTVVIALLLAAMHGRLLLPVEYRGGEGRAIRILYANVWIHNPDRERVRALIEREDADLVLVTEVSKEWIADLQLEGRYPYRFLHPGRSADGSALYSKFPIRTSARIPEGAYFAALAVQLEVAPGRHVPLVFVHAPPPQIDLDFRERARFFSEIGRYVSGVGSAIVVGDFNTAYSSVHFSRLKNLLGLVDSADGRFPFATWHVREVPFIRTKIDHLFHGEGVSVQRASRMEDIGSDHYPILWEVQLQ